jgi:hypothetical protein
LKFVIKLLQLPRLQILKTCAESRVKKLIRRVQVGIGLLTFVPIRDLTSFFFEPAQQCTVQLDEVDKNGQQE